MNIHKYFSKTKPKDYDYNKVINDYLEYCNSDTTAVLQALTRLSIYGNFDSVQKLKLLISAFNKIPELKLIDELLEAKASDFTYTQEVLSREIFKCHKRVINSKKYSHLNHNLSISYSTEPKEK